MTKSKIVRQGLAFLVALFTAGVLTLGTGSSLRASASYNSATPPALLIDSPVQGKRMDSGAIIRHRFVTINQAALRGNSFTIQLFDNIRYTAVIDSKEDLRKAVGPAAGEGFLWTGRLVEVPGSQVMLIASDGLLIANISLPDTSLIYFVDYAGGGKSDIHALYEVDRSLYPPDQHMYGSTPDGISSTEKHLGSPGRSRSSIGGDAPTSSTIGVLAVSTSQAITDAGGFSAISVKWYMAVAWTNKALDNSKIAAKLVIQALGGVNYEEKDMITDAVRFWTCGDGEMDEICDWRTQYGGDLAQLAGSGYNGGGVATMPGWGSAVDWTGLQAGYISAHEWGHNAGSGHDRGEGFRGWFEDSYGYIDPSGWFGDVMSYRSFQPLYQGYSNPDVCWNPPSESPDCVPTGIALPSPQSANNARVMNYFAPIIAGWK